MTSEPPDETLVDNLRLPFRTIATFFDAIPLGALDLDRTLKDGITGEPRPTDEMSLVGVVLHSGADGTGIADDVQWLLSSALRDAYGVVAVIQIH